MAETVATGVHHVVADTSAQHEKGYRSTSDEAWGRESAAICRECGQGWPCDAGLLQSENERLRAALAAIAQYDPRWEGQHVNDAPNRQQLIERAYDALGGHSEVTDYG